MTDSKKYNIALNCTLNCDIRIVSEDVEHRLQAIHQAGVIRLYVSIRFSPVQLRGLAAFLSGNTYKGPEQSGLLYW